MIFKTIYKRTQTGAIQLWQAEVEGDKYRTISGQDGGVLTASAWTVCVGKNVGKQNHTTGETQALAEVKAMYKKRLEKDYVESIGDVDEGGYFKPMLCENYSDCPVTGGVIYIQPKLDGIRCIATKDGCFTRNGKQHVNIPHIVELLKPFFEKYPHVVLDGELYNHVLKDDFNEICSLVKKTKPTKESIEASAKYIQYHIYDCFITNNAQMKTSDRQLFLTKIFQQEFAKSGDALVLTEITARVFIKNEDNIDQEIKEAHDTYCELGYEGIIVRLEAPYVNKRSKNILKYKSFITEEYKLIRVEEGKGNWSGYAKLAEFKTVDGKHFKAGIKGNRAFCKDLLDKAEELKGTMCTVKYLNLTPDGIPRHGIVVEFNRKDI
jgi:DNA ligase-1